jgi:hypothetical protein
MTTERMNMTDDIPVSEKSKNDAKREKPPRAVEKAAKKVSERGKPRLETDSVDSAPDSDPRH